MPKSVPFLFTMICVAGGAALIYFGHSAALQSVPAYSTLNTNPDGAKLLFDGLHEAGVVQVSRQFKSVALQKPQFAAVFFLGVRRENLAGEGESFFNEMENAASRGNDLIIALPNEEDDFVSYKSRKKPLLETRWGIDVTSLKPGLDKNWQSIGSSVWRRTFGKGAITLVFDGQRLNNKSVAGNEENRRLLLQLVKGYPSAVFEEAHLGIVETGSIAGLARHYRLQGLIAGLILLAVLFVWSRSVSFPPIPPAPEKTLAGADTRSMLTELMSRHLKGQLIIACIAEWNRTRGRAPALAQPSESNAVTAYIKIQESMQNRTKFTL